MKNRIEPQSTPRPQGTLPENLFAVFDLSGRVGNGAASSLVPSALSL
jgi:hypothetical protein